MAELRHNDLNSLFTDIANALREKGASGNLIADNFDLAIKNISSGTKSMDLLWTNSSPNTIFSAQTITLNLSNYNGVIITHKNNCSDASVGYRTYVPVGESCRLDSGWISSGRQTANRLCSVYPDRIEFQVGRTNTTTNSLYLIPIEIYGV